MEYKITYDHGAIDAMANSVVQQSFAMQDTLNDVEKQTNSLLSVFLGIGATSFGDHQRPFLQSGYNIIETVQRLGQTIHVVCGDAEATDHLISHI